MSQEAWGAQSPNIDDPEYRVPNPQPWRSTRIEQLLQLFHGATWDGDLISKSDRKELVKEGLAIQQRHGYNLITCKGVTYLYRLGIIHP